MASILDFDGFRASGSSALLSHSRELEMESRDIMSALNAFREARSSAMRAQNLAFQLYDQELNDIGSVDDIDRQLDALELQEEQGDEVEHNLMRHLNADQSSSAKLTIDDFFLDDDNALFNDPHRSQIRFQEALKSRHATMQAGGYQKEIPPPEAKVELRNAIFAFLDESRVQEDVLEQDYEKIKDSEGPIVEQTAVRLYNLQKKNCQQLKQMIKGYHPATSGTAWGNDPDYIKLTHELRESMARGKLKLNL